MKIKILLVLLVALVTSSCKEVDKFTHFNMSFDEPMDLPTFPWVLPEPLFFNVTKDTNSANTFLTHNTSKDLIEEIILTEAKITIVSTTGDFSFLETVRFYLDVDEDREEEVLIASKLFVPDDIGKTIELDIIGQDLSSFLKEDQLTLRIEVDNDEVLTDELELMIHINFFVDAKILGV
jgi:hypothetical protein